jgi:hypothetical protein
LKLAIDHSVEKVQAGLESWMAQSRKWGAAEVLSSLAPVELRMPAVAELTPDLNGYDRLLCGQQDSREVAHVD